MNTPRILSTAIIACATLAACNSVELIDPPQPPDNTDTGTGIIPVEVLDYSPAPGQFVNVLPTFKAGDDAAAMRQKAQEALNNGHEITLGAFGGSVTLRLSQAITDAPGPDFRVLGNAIIAGTGSDGRQYGSCEPGIVEVMYDANANGLPDDTWYELAGSAHSSSVPSFTVRYSAPAADAADATYIPWEAADGTSGWLPRLAAFHSQPYYPQWIQAPTLSFTARRLPDNGVYNPATGRYDLYCLSGYADAYPDNNDKSCLDIASAIDSDGRTVHLDAIHFIRITTAVLQVNGPLGEYSTEVAGIATP